MSKNILKVVSLSIAIFIFAFAFAACTPKNEPTPPPSGSVTNPPNNNPNDNNVENTEEIDYTTVIGLGDKELVEKFGEGQVVNGTGDEAETITGRKYQHKIFGLESESWFEYEADKVKAATFNIANKTKQEIVEAVNKLLGNPASETGEGSQYQAIWEKDGYEYVLTTDGKSHFIKLIKK